MWAWVFRDLVMIAVGAGLILIGQALVPGNKDNKGQNNQ
jgi:hypothetical protein